MLFRDKELPSSLFWKKWKKVLALVISTVCNYEKYVQLQTPRLECRKIPCRGVLGMRAIQHSEHLVLSINKHSRCVYIQTTKGASCPASLHVISPPFLSLCSPCLLVLSCSVVLAPGGGLRQVRLLQPSAPYSPTFSGPG